MLPKKERLSVRDINSLSQGRSVFGSRMSLRFSPALEKKFSVSVSKKIAKRAIDRNRLRRRIYSALRTEKKLIIKPYFIMIMPKRECLTIGFEEIKKELGSLFSKAGLSA